MHVLLDINSLDDYSLDNDSLDNDSLGDNISLMRWINKPVTSDPCMYTISNLPQVGQKIA